jgi:CYTH domain-containing protein
VTSKYARTERERRFVCAAPPPRTAVVRRRLIVDRYLDGTRLRLRRVEELDGSGPAVHKLTQKLPGSPWGELTTMYISEQEHTLLTSLPAAVLVKERWSVPPLGYDVFRGPLEGLVLAEVEFEDDGTAAAYEPPDGAHEVTDDLRFTGGALVRARPEDVLSAARAVLGAARAVQGAARAAQSSAVQATSSGPA